MQAFDPTLRYGDAAVVAALQGAPGGRMLDFRYELLDRTNAKIADLGGVLPGTVVSQDTSADVKRTASFSLREGIDSIDYLSNRIKPYIRLQMPDGGWVEWPQGVFLLSSPTRSLDVNRTVIRNVAAYDQLVVLSGDAVPDRYSMAAGTPFVSALYTLAIGAGIPAVSITPSNLTLPVTWDYEAGTPKLTIMNDLLSAMNYRSAWFNEVGTLICAPYVLPENRQIEYTYATDNTSVIVGTIDQSLDLFSIPNRWVLTVSDTDQGSFSSSFTNTDPASPTSTVSRGRTILSFDAGQSAADQATLDALVRKTAYESSQVYETESFNTAIMPFHSEADIVGVTVPDLGMAAVKTEELSWSMSLQVGGTMSHSVRRSIVTAGGG